MSRALALLRLVAGLLAGWVAHPSLWLAVGSPVRWLHLVLSRAWVESRFNPDAVGDGGRSVGVLQFVDSTRAALFPEWTSEQWACPARQGWAAAAYVAAALAACPRWYVRLRLPAPWGPAALSYLWTCGASRSCATAPWADLGTNARGAYRGVVTRWSRSAAVGAWAAGLVLALPLGLAWVGVLTAGLRGRRV